MMRRLGQLVGWGYSLAALGFLTLPVVIMVPASLSAGDVLEFPPRGFSLRWYAAVLANEQWLNSALLSARIGVLAAVAATLAGLCLGIVHLRLGRVRPAARTFLMLPLLAPHVVLATGMFSLLIRLRLLGSSWVLAFTHAAFALPITMVLFIAAVETVDPLVWTAASTLGARSGFILRKVIFPAIAPSIVIAFVLAFVISWDEVTFAVFVGPTVVPTLPARMFSYLRELINPSVTAIATLLLLVTGLGGLVIAGITKARARRYAASRAPAPEPAGH